MAPPPSSCTSLREERKNLDFLKIVLPNSKSMHTLQLFDFSSVSTLLYIIGFKMVERSGDETFRSFSVKGTKFLALSTTFFLSYSANDKVTTTAKGTSIDL